MTDADLRALCARVARDAFGRVQRERRDYASLVVDIGGAWHICYARSCEKRLMALPLVAWHPNADALAAALYDAAKAQGAAEGGPSQVAADTEGGKR